MNYVFTYIGEFGYELFNWQGAIRKWSKYYKNPEDKIIICARSGLQSVYELPTFYGAETIKGLMAHTQALVQDLQELEEVFFLTDIEEEEYNAEEEES